MDIKIDGNPGTGNTFQEIHIGSVQNYNPNATTVINYNGWKEEPTDSTHPTKGESLAERMKEPDPKRDLTIVRTAILNYIDRVRPLLTEEVKQGFQTMWEKILSLPEVESKICTIGKQQGTDFNRDLIANILYYLRHRKVYKEVYRDNINGAALAFALEGNKDHAVKRALREDPPVDVRDAIDRLLGQP